MFRSIFLSALILLLTVANTFANPLPITPYPNQVKITGGSLNLSKGAQISGNSTYTSYLKELLENDFQIKTDKGVRITLQLQENESQNREAYQLNIHKKEILISAADEAGIFYGIQSLRQLLMNSLIVPQVEIEDEPAFAWRSYMLDEARYFQGKETVKRILDDMALLKYNYFHWHLTNDAGWRIEIKAYPLLTEIGSKRDSSQVNHEGKKWASKVSDHTEHKGFYTQEEIKEIIAYAAERQITIIPEVSMPGHFSAAIASYPLLGTTKKKISVPTNFGVVKEVLDVSSPGSYEFVHRVLDEVSALFPSSYIHIGGDEVKYDQWEESPYVNAYMKAHNVKTYRDLQVFFTNEISQYVDQKLGKRIIGWNEILGQNVHDWAKDANAETALSKNAVVQFWKGKAEDLMAGIDKGHDVINSDHTNTYIDYTYKQIPLRKSYDFNPIPEGIEESKKKQIVGLGAQMWGEWTPSKNEVEYQTYPRIAAYAEVGWTHLENKDYTRFRENVNGLMKYWSSKGYNLPEKFE